MNVNFLISMFWLCGEGILCLIRFSDGFTDGQSRGWGHTAFYDRAPGILALSLSSLPPHLGA